MAGIIVITTKGKAKMDFINSLQRETDGAVVLAILQNVRKKSSLKRIQSFYGKVGLFGIVLEIFYFLTIKLSRKKRETLRVLSERSETIGVENNYLAETIETDNINEDMIYDRLKKVAPDLIVILGGYILKSRLLETARYAINMHSGFVPYYRGVNGIENAILNNDFEHIGITIHYAVAQVDAGEVIKIISANHCTSSGNFFKVLNDTAMKEYAKVAKEILDKGKVQSTPQDLTLGRNYLLKEWTYKKQNTLANKIINWPKSFI